MPPIYSHSILRGKLLFSSLSWLLMPVIHTRSMRQLRRMALTCYHDLSATQYIQPDDRKHSTTQRIVQSLKEPLRSHKKRHAVTLGGKLHRDSSTKRPLRVDDVNVLEDPEPTKEGTSKVEHQQRHNSRQQTQVDKGRVRTGIIGKVLNPKRILKLFRVNEKKLA